MDDIKYEKIKDDLHELQRSQQSKIDISVWVDIDGHLSLIHI